MAVQVMTVSDELIAIVQDIGGFRLSAGSINYV